MIQTEKHYRGDTIPLTGTVLFASFLIDIP